MISFWCLIIGVCQKWKRAFQIVCFPCIQLTVLQWSFIGVAYLCRNERRLMLSAHWNCPIEMKREMVGGLYKILQCQVLWKSVPWGAVSQGGFLVCNFCANQVFYFLLKGSTCSRGSVQQTGQEWGSRAIHGISWCAPEMWSHEEVCRVSWFLWLNCLSLSF